MNDNECTYSDCTKGRLSPLLNTPRMVLTCPVCNRRMRPSTSIGGQLIYLCVGECTYRKCVCEYLTRSFSHTCVSTIMKSRGVNWDTAVKIFLRRGPGDRDWVQV